MKRKKRKRAPDLRRKLEEAAVMPAARDTERSPFSCDTSDAVAVELPLAKSESTPTFVSLSLSLSTTGLG